MVTDEDRLPRSFGWLNATQFLGALNDNVFKLFLVYFIIALKGEEAAATAGVLGLVLLATPFLLFSAVAGILADRVSKNRVIVVAKLSEVCAMSLGVAAFAMRSVPLLCVVMFMMATQSAFFGPVKYGIVPELVGRERLSKANGLLQAFTYLAIIIGTVLAPFLSQALSRNYVLATLFCVGVAVVGVVTSLPITRTPPAGSQRRASWFFLRDIWRTLRDVRRDKYLFLAVLASAYFLMLGAYMQFNLIPYGIEALGLSQEDGSYLFLFAAIGIAAGALLAGRLSGRNVELGVVPLGAVGLTAASLALGGRVESLMTVRALVFLMGLSSGLFIVPIQAWIQFRSPPDRRGEILAASGFLSWIGVIVAAGLIHTLSNVLGLTARQGFIALGLLTLVLTVITLCILPDFVLRFICVVVTRFCYRVRTVGLGNVPTDGPALLVCNHVSYVDALLLLATQQRRIRFMADRNVYEKRRYHVLMRLLGVIPVQFRDSPKKIIEALRDARAALDAGYLVCIFAEGAITRTGNLLAFKGGFRHIVRGAECPIVPVYLGGAWGSIFSYAHGQLMSRWPLRFPYPVTVLFGSPLPPDVSTMELREKVQELSCEYFDQKKPARRPLGEEFVKTARQNWTRPAVSDTSGKRLTFGQTLTAALGVSELIEPQLGAEPHVGILLPASVGGVLANVAVSLLNRIPVNLNYTASGPAFASAIEQCGIRSVLTSHRFLEKIGQLPLPSAIYIEDVLADLGLNHSLKRRAFLRARFLPKRWLVSAPDFDADQVATVIFSSGSTGEPKGVMLSHHNIASDIESLRMLVEPSPKDVLGAVLPFFHSFGFTATLWHPLLSGFRAVYHPNPLEGDKIAELVRENKASVLFATPTFLMAYVRRAKPEDFASLRLVIVGAEKLKPRVADMFEKRFGIRPLEGYGATELAPVATLNIPDVEIAGARHVGVKEGSVGQPVPGVVVRIVDPDTQERLPPGEPGLMLVKGPNVMRGYLNRHEETAKVLVDGWYNTGDIAKLDEDGFVIVTDRLSRFSKIGGEMVPHVGIEEALHQVLGKGGQVLVVTAVPDERKGEKLVVLYTDEAGTEEDIQRAIADSDLANLCKPGRNALFRIDSLPMLGSGKLDLKGIRRIAMERSVTAPET